MSSRRSASENAGRRKTEGIALKRSRGEASCAECRRLKLKCDRAVPCSSCVRRGCRAICPNGVLSSGQGSRFILADTNELHRKVTDMSSRIRQLEDALTIAHATSSQTPHPLMAPDLLEIKHGVSAVGDRQDNSHATGTDELDKDIMLSFGDLTLAESGCSGVLFTAYMDPDNSSNADQPDSHTPSQSELPPEIMRLSRTFPFASLYLPENEIQELIEQRLPTYERASALCESYLQHVSWWARPIGREQLVEELLPTAYQQRRGRTSTQASGSSAQEQEKTRMDPHDLAALLMVFASGAVSDFTLNPCNEEAVIYLHLSRAALGIKPVLERATLSAVQAVTLMGVYDFFSWRKKSLESTWKMRSFAMMLATSIGLHRDPTHWKFEPKMIQRRREAFWELMFLDAWKCLGSGRPAGVHSDDVDCELPIDSDATLDEEGKEVPSFWRWKYMFLRDVLLGVVQRLVSAKPLKYTDILILDGKVREFGPRYLARQITNQISGEGLNGADGVRAYLQKYMLSLNKSFVIQFLHRNFFARALLENPENPMKSTFAPSFLAAYNSALAILRVVREHFKIIPHVVLRSWSALTHSLTASMILGSVAARVPASEMAPQAYINLDLSIGTLMQAQSHPAIQAGLPGLLRLREKARVALIGIGIDPDQIVKDSKVMSERASEKEKSGNLRRREEAYELDQEQSQRPGTISLSSISDTERQAVTPEDNRTYTEPLAPVASDVLHGKEATGMKFIDQGDSEMSGGRNQASLCDGSTLQAHSQSQAESQEFDLFSDIDLTLDISPEQYIQSLKAPTIFPSCSMPPGSFSATSQHRENSPSFFQGDPGVVGLRLDSGQTGMEIFNNTSQMSFGMQESEFAALMALDVGPLDFAASGSSSSMLEGFNTDWSTGLDTFSDGTRADTEALSLASFFGAESLSTTGSIGEQTKNARLERLLRGNAW